jgi:hypothetical protein
MPEWIVGLVVALRGKLSEATRRTFACPPRAFNQLVATIESPHLFYSNNFQSINHLELNSQLPYLLTEPPFIMSNPYEGSPCHMLHDPATLTSSS